MSTVIKITKELLAARELVEGLEKMENPVRVSVQDKYEHIKDFVKSIEGEVNKQIISQRDQFLSNYRKALEV